MENIILGTSEDITDFTDEEQVKVRIVNLELKQQYWLDGEKRDFMIFNGKQCHQRVEYKNGSKRKFRVNLSYLNAIPRRQTRYAYNWFIFSAMMFMIAAMSVYAIFKGFEIDVMMAGGLAAGSALVAISALIYASMKSTCRIIFTSNHGNAPVLELIDGSPNGKAFMTFIDVLQQKINSYNQPRNSDMRQYLLEELDELRRLKNEGVIASSVFNSAMKRIIKNPSYKV
jgi:hypothetical protein